MLISLSIKNFLIIESAYIDFHSGFIVITGETGSGKSLIIDALLFCLGSKLEAAIRKDCEQCCIIAEIDIRNNQYVKAILEENSIEQDGSIIIKRQELANKRKKFFINDEQVTQKLVNQVSQYLFEIHGQHSNTLLLDPKSHREILDSYAGLENERNQLQESYKLWQENKRKLQEISSQREKNNEEISYLEFVTKELQKANIINGEETELLNKRNQLHQIFNQQKTAHQALKLLEDSSSSKTIVQVSKILNKEPNFSSCCALIDQVLLNIDEIRIELQNKLLEDNLEQQIIQIEDRLFEIRTLAKKHNVSVENLSNFLQMSLAKLKNLLHEVENEQEYINQDTILFETFKQNCLALSEKRQKAAAILAIKINMELAELISPNASFKAELNSTPVENGSANGIDQVRFTVKTNLGMDYMPIDEVASGGELSRIMLAMKSVILKAAARATVIFDEVDSGVGGAVAEVIGYKLKDLSKACQVISITHQPQIASKADQHLLVHKTQQHNQTFSHIKSLTQEERVQEVARMLSGKEITAKTKDVAKEMIDTR